jgi:hypothetical protein
MSALHGGDADGQEARDQCRIGRPAADEERSGAGYRSLVNVTPLSRARTRTPSAANRPRRAKSSTAPPAAIATASAIAAARRASPVAPPARLSGISLAISESPVRAPM